MSQTNTKTGGSNTNSNQHTGRGGWGQGGSDSRGGRGDCRNSTIVKSLFVGEMIDGCLHKFTITECSHWATQFKKINYALPVLCVDKGFKFVDNVKKGILSSTYTTWILVKQRWKILVTTTRWRKGNHCFLYSIKKEPKQSELYNNDVLSCQTKIILMH